MKKRIEYLDALKAISILLVVFCHKVLLPKTSLAGNAVMSMAWAAVPCFMMTTGALVHRPKTFSWDKHFRKLGKAYLIFIIWRLIYLVVNIMLSSLHFSKAQIFSYLFLLKDLEGVDTGVLWYMLAYFVVMILYPATWYLFQSEHGKRVLILFGIAAGISGILIPSGNWVLTQLSMRTGWEEISLNDLNRIMPFTNYGSMLFYFILGGFLFSHNDMIAEKLKNKWYVSTVLILAGTVGLMTIKRLDTGSWRWADAYLMHGYHHFMTMLLSLGLYLLFSCSTPEKPNHILAVSIGRYTMGVYYMHYLILTICQALIYPYLTNYFSFWLNCAKTLAVTGVCLVLTVLIRKIPGIRMMVS